MTPSSKASRGTDDDHRARRHLRAVPDRPPGARYTFGILHADTPALAGPTRAEIFDVLPEPLQREAWGALRVRVDGRERAQRAEAVAE